MLATTRTYLFNYNHAGERWSFKVQASSVEDAWERISKMQFANYDGELIAEIPASVGWLAPVVCRIRNLWVRSARQDRTSP